MLLRLVDGLCDEASIDAALWQELCRECSAPELLELTALTGFYHMIAFIANGTALPMEDFAVPFPAPQPEHKETTAPGGIPMARKTL